MSDKIEYIELRTVDILGRLKAMVVPCKPADSIAEVGEDPILENGTSIDGSSIVGLSRVEASDLRMSPDSASLVELPYSLRRTAAVMCFIREKGSKGTKEYYPTDSRGVLHRICESLLKDDTSLRIKIEPEFHFVTPEGEKFDTSAYADTYPASPAMDVLLEIASSIQGVGMVPRVAHHEGGESQQEIEIDYDDIRTMADNLIAFKNIARAIAEDSGITVNFMPKPFENAAGSGLHCHLQLWKGEKNLFGDDFTNDLSDLARSFIAGLLVHAPAITAIANPTVNSYKRLVPHHEAPVYISWGMMNRTALVRIPLFETSEKAAIELRSPDPMTNPYLLFSAILVAGMDGVAKNLVPIDPTSKDIFTMTEEEKKSIGIVALPASLGEALDSLDADDVIKNGIGKEIVARFITIKRREWNHYLNEIVTEWEWEAYSEL
ncbi:MAG: glutamine synthetase family protein [Candidatus Thorarchaeota archaeon]